MERIQLNDDLLERFLGEKVVEVEISGVFRN